MSTILTSVFTTHNSGDVLMTSSLTDTTIKYSNFATLNMQGGIVKVNNRTTISTINMAKMGRYDLNEKDKKITLRTCAVNFLNCMSGLAVIESGSKINIANATDDGMIWVEGGSINKLTSTAKEVSIHDGYVDEIMLHEGKLWIKERGCVRKIYINEDGALYSGRRSWGNSNTCLTPYIEQVDAQQGKLRFRGDIAIGKLIITDKTDIKIEEKVKVSIGKIVYNGKRATDHVAFLDLFHVPLIY